MCYPFDVQLIVATQEYEFFDKHQVYIMSIMVFCTWKQNAKWGIRNKYIYILSTIH